MSKKCAKCDKTVYPTEEFRCLDQTWHKFCFKCWECGMALTMKNYKGYNKKPYCCAHYPTTKFTAVADTPEMARLAQNTRQQSNLKYHEEFERAKGHYTSVTDDPETLRLLQNQQKFSGVKYHEEFEKQKGTKVSVVDEPELNRLKKNQANMSQIEYTGLKSRHAAMEAKRDLIGAGGEPLHRSMMPPPPAPVPVMVDSPASSKNVSHSTAYNSQGKENEQPEQKAEVVSAPAGTTTVYGADGKVEQGVSRSRVGSIADYDPMAENWGSLGSGYNPSVPGGRHEWEETVPASAPNRQPEPQPSQPQYYPPPQQAPPQQPQPPLPPAPPKTKSFKAMYDYDAQDNDEVSFRDGDVIIDSESIDEGWMIGTIQRTGQRGMLPANYVEVE